MSCNKCKHLLDIQDLSSPYVIRECSDCNRKINLREAGDNGHGIKMEKGDQFIFPKNFIKMSANPLKSTVRLSKGGLEWFAKLIFVNDLPTKRESIQEEIKKNGNYSAYFQMTPQLEKEFWQFTTK